MYYLVNFVILILTSIATLLIYYHKTYKHWREQGVVYPKPIPFFGNGINLYCLRYGMGYYAFQLYRTYKEPFVGFFVGSTPYLLIRDPNLLKHFLVKDHNIFSSHSMECNKTGDTFSAYFLFIIKKAEWKTLRSALSPIFTTSKLKAMFNLMSDNSKALQEYLRRNISAGSGTELSMRGLFDKFTTDVVMNVVYGVKTNCLENDRSELLDVPANVFNWSKPLRTMHVQYMCIAPAVSNLLNFQFIDTVTAKLMKNIMWTTMLEREKTNVERNDVIDIMVRMKKEKNITDYSSVDCDILCAQGAQFYVAGFEASSVTISCTLYELAKNPKLQDTLRKELLEIKARGDNTFTYENIRTADYLDMCIKETLRKYPVLPFLDRICEADYKIPGTEVMIKKGTVVYISTLGMHLDPKYYPDPDKYDPERFSPNNETKRPMFTYLPFGAGPRFCIGKRYGMMSAKNTIAHMVTEYKVTMSEKTPTKLKFFKNGFLLSPRGGIPLRLHKL